MLRLADRWIWDFWLADTGDSYHAYFLQAPRSLGDPQLRHRHASIGHATSDDLRRWTVRGDAVRPGAPGSWDDLATWTGSVIRSTGRWWMFYSAISTVEDGAVQRIGAATSTDLSSWTKHPSNPLIEADGRWYERADRHPTEAWRDPWLLADPDGDGFHALITARANVGPVDGRGVIAHASSPNLVDWEVHPPVTQPGEFGELEVPQIVERDGRAWLVFSVGQRQVAARRLGRVGTSATSIYVCPGPSSVGPFDIERDARAITADDRYSGRIVVDRADRAWLLAFVDRDANGAFVGELADPTPFDFGDASIQGGSSPREAGATPTGGPTTGAVSRVVGSSTTESPSGSPAP